MHKNENIKIAHSRSLDSNRPGRTNMSKKYKYRYVLSKRMLAFINIILGLVIAQKFSKEMKTPRFKAIKEQKSTSDDTKISNLVNNPTGVVFGRKGCPYCYGACELMAEKQIKFTYIPVEHHRELKEEFEKKYDHKTVPIVFLNGRFIGGYTQLSKLLKEENK